MQASGLSSAHVPVTTRVPGHLWPPLAGLYAVPKDPLLWSKNVVHSPLLMGSSLFLNLRVTWFPTTLSIE